MSAKKWIKTWIIIFLSILIIVGGFNYIIDPYGTNNSFNLNVNQSKPGSTKRPLHFKLPIVKQGNIDNLLLGTSRIGVMKIEAIQKYLTGNTFNLSSPASLTEEHYSLLKYAIQNNHIKNVIYGLDFLSLNGARKKLESDFSKIKDDIANNINIQDNLLIYFSLDSLNYSFSMLRGEKCTTYLKDGQRDYQIKKEKIAHNKLHLKYEISHIKNNIQYTPYKYSKNMMGYVKKIVQLCKDNNINLIIYTPPMYAEHFKNIYNYKHDDFISFKKELSQITNYIDLSGINSISINKNNYYDFSHLRDNMSSLIFATIFHDKDSDIPNDFGVSVDKNTINKHLKNLENQVKNYNVNIESKKF